MTEKISINYSQEHLQKLCSKQITSEIRMIIINTSKTKVTTIDSHDNFKR